MTTHEIIRNKNGTYSLRERRSGEVMHSNVGPREEATLLYTEQSRLAQHLSLEGPPLVLWDVGLGAGSNALAALQVAQALGSKQTRRLEIVSFENDPSGFRLALENQDKLPFFESLEKAAGELASVGHWESPDRRLSWRLIEGDFLVTAASAPRPEIVYFDLYSPNVAREHWSVDAFARVRAAAGPGPCDLYTYSAATRVRVALLLAGFFVGYGRSTGAKVDTTAASTSPDRLERPLDARWWLRLERSHDPLPHGWPADGRQDMLESVARHEQFATLKK